jgi:hypothetical protein
MQTSAVHTGVCVQCDGIVDRLFRQLVSSELNAE